MVISRICSLFSLCCATVLYQSVFPSYFDLCMSGAPSGSSGDPRREFEANWGERGTRGIRGGKAARRKRDAFRRYESERLGIPIDQVAVVHQGGQSRPLHTSPYWIPDQSDREVVSSDEAVEAVEAPASDQVTSGRFDSVGILRSLESSHTGSSAIGARVEAFQSGSGKPLQSFASSSTFIGSIVIIFSCTS